MTSENDVRPKVTWTRPMLERFKTAHKEALKNGRDSTFSFDGNEYVVAFAGYLIEYLDPMLAGA